MRGNGRRRLGWLAVVLVLVALLATSAWAEEKLATTVEKATKSGDVYGMTTRVSGKIACAGECVPTGSVKVTVTTYLTHTSGLPPFTASGTLNAEGRYSVSFTGLPHGAHSMKIEYQGDDRHAASMDANQMLSIYFPFLQTEFNVTEGASYGDDITISGYIRGQAGTVPEKPVQLIVDGNTVAARALGSSGEFSCTLSGVSAGSHTLKLVLESDGNHSSYQTERTFEVKKRGVRLADVQIQRGEGSVFLNGKLLTTDGKPVQPGNVRVVFDGGKSALCALSQAGGFSAFDDLPTAEGKHTISVRYDGNENYEALGGNAYHYIIGKLTPVVALDFISDIAYNDSGTVVGSVRGDADVGKPTGTVTVDIEGLSSENVSLSVDARYERPFTATWAKLGTYTVTVTYSGDERYYGASATTTVTVVAARPNTPAIGEGYTIDYRAETIDVWVGYEMNRAVDFSGEIVASGMMVQPGQGLFLRKAAQGNYLPSLVVLVNIPARPDAPAGLQGVDETAPGRSDGRIEGTSTAMEYQRSGEAGWTTCPDGAVTGLEPGAYEVRVKATERSFAGQTTQVTISVKARLAVKVRAFEAVTYGYERPLARYIYITNTGDGDAVIDRVQVSGAAYSVGGKGDLVKAGETMTSRRIQPKAGLNAGTYVAAVTVTYEGGAKATTRVSFTVNKAQQDAPAAPEVLASASGWVILKEAAASSAGTAAQYSKDGGETWQANGVFVGLAEGETYAFAVRYAEDENHEASLASEITRVAAEDGGESVVCSRELAALLLWHAENCPEPTGEIVPADVEPESWYADAIAWAMEAGLFENSEDGLFQPEEPLARDVLETALQQLALYRGYDETEITLRQESGDTFLPAHNGEDASAPVIVGEFTSALRRFDEAYAEKP